MANEVQWQRKIIQKISSEGSFGKKWATEYAVGVPDLILSLHKIGMAAVEIKLEKRWHKNTVRTLSVSEKQAYVLNEIHMAGGVAGVLLVIEQSPKEAYLSLHKPPLPRMALSVERDEALCASFKWSLGSNLSDWLTDEMRAKL